MSGLWAKFYWSDYRGDPALKLCSLAAQGLWMQMLCIAADADPIGYLVVNSRPLGATDLARLTGASEAEVTGLLNELSLNGVFSLDSKSRIYNRRMVRDARRSAMAKKNGKLGGNPSLSETTGKSSEVNPQDKATLKPNMPEARSQKEKPEAKASVKKMVTLPNDFTLTEGRRSVAHEKGIIDAEFEFTRFCDGARAKRRTYADWDAAWRNWCDSSYQDSNPNSNRFRGQRSGAPRSGSITGAAGAVIAAGGEPGLRARGVPGRQAPDPRAAVADYDPFAELDAASRSTVRREGGDAVLIVDQEPSSGR